MQPEKKFSQFFLSAFITTVVVSLQFITILGLSVGTAEAAGASVATQRGSAIAHASYPVQVYIPSIKLNSAIKPVSTNAKGELDVPSGKTNNVGWYKYGTAPGNIGSAVLDAHVFAAFKNLHRLKPGSDIYIAMSDKKVLHYVVAEAQTYPLALLSPQTLFAQNDTARLNLITCAGKYIASKGTYDKRHIVFAKLVTA